MKKLKGKITISRPTLSHGEPYLSITLVDSVAGVEAIEIQMGLAEFTEALTGMGRVECDFSWNDSGRVGKVREMKTEPVFVPDGPWDSRIDAAKSALAAYEIDGWAGSTSDAMNHHRCMRGRAPEGTKGSWYSVGFERWVEPPRGEPAE